MIFGKTLTRQFVTITLILFLFLSINTYSDFVFTRNMKGKAAGIDLAGQLKSMTFEMAWLAESLVEKEIIVFNEHERQDLIGDLSASVARYDRMIAQLKSGAPELGIKPLRDPDMLQLLGMLEGNWHSAMRPILVRIAGLNADVPERQGRELVHLYGEKLHSVGANVDRLVSLLLLAYEDDIRKFDIFRFCMLGFFCVAALFTILYIRQNIARPIQSFVKAAREIEKGNFDIHVEVSNRDEVGELGQAFNRMADEIENAFGEILWHSEDVMALNRALNKFIGLQNAEDLYKAICDHGRELFGLSATWLGMLNEGDHNVAIVACSGCDEDYISHTKVTWDDSVYGMGPEGIAIKTNLPYIVNDMELADASLPEIQLAVSRGYRSCMAHPLICANCAVVGVMVFYSDQKDHFTANMTELCQIFVNHAASVIENVILLKDLENRVQERTEKLQDALLLAEGANAAKSAFLSNMSHDLRTPLNAIIGFSEAMSQGIYGEMRPDHKEYLDYIYQSGMKLLKLINEILDLSKMESGDMELEFVECSISDIINSSLYIFREKAKKHRIAIDLEVAEDARSVTVDEIKIKQIMVNLLTDSIKSTPDGGEIHIRVSRSFSSLSGIQRDVKAGEADAPISGDSALDCIRVEIADTRPGMTAAERARLFDPYKQFDTTLDRKQDNVGLLLSKRFVDLHGGRIWSEGLSGEMNEDFKTDGNRFVFVLPQRL